MRVNLCVFQYTAGADMKEKCLEKKEAKRVEQISSRQE